MADSNGQVTLQILGPLDLRSAQGRELRSVLTQPKRLTLLAFLALTGSGRFCRRDTVIALFWPDLDQVRARAALRQALSWLRRELGDEILVSRGDEEIGVAAEALRCDAVGFDEACDAGRPERALSLYRGQLLEGVFVAGAGPELEQWIEGERSRLRERATQAAWALAQQESAVGRAERAAHWGRRATLLAPHDEEGARRLIELLAAAGNRAGALEEYTRFREVLRADLDAEPSSETQRLVARLRADTTRPSGSPSAPSAEGSTDEPAGPGPMHPAAPRPAPGFPALRPRPVSRVLAIAVVFFAVVATGSLAWRLMGRPDHTTAAGDIPSLVVLPLINATGDTTLDYLAQGVTGAVTAALSRVPSLRVVGPRAVARSLGPDSDPVRAAKAAGTALALAWRLSRPGDSLMVEAEIERAGDETRIRAVRYRFLPEQLQLFEREIAESLLTVLTPGPGTRPPGNLARHPTSDPDAYLLLLKAEYYLGRRTPTGIRQARDLVQQAIDRDPLYADAWAVLSQSYEGFAWYGLLPADQAFLKSEAAARRAVALDSTSGLAHATLGATLSFFRYRWAEGEKELRRAVALDPLNAEIRNFYSLHWRSVGQFDKALGEMRQAQALDPLFRHYFRSAGLVLALAGRDEEAVVEYRRALELDSTFTSPRALLSEALARLGRYDEALRELRLAALTDGDDTSAAILNAVRGEIGYREVTRRFAAQDVQRLRRARAEGRYVQPYRLADALLEIGDREGGIAALEQAFAVRDPGIIALPYAPEYRGIQDDPRVQALIRQMNLR